MAFVGFWPTNSGPEVVVAMASLLGLLARLAAVHFRLARLPGLGSRLWQVIVGRPLELAWRARRQPVACSLAIPRKQVAAGAPCSQLAMVGSIWPACCFRRSKS